MKSLSPQLPGRMTQAYYPRISDYIFNHYAAQKKEGSMGQQEKAFRILQSRKIVSVKVLGTNTNQTNVKSTISRSYGHKSRPAVMAKLRTKTL